MKHKYNIQKRNELWQILKEFNEERFSRINTVYISTVLSFEFCHIEI